MTSLLDPSLKHTLKKDKELLENTKLPIITVSATYVEDLKGYHQFPEIDSSRDVVFSRAHYSMALAVAVEAWQNKIDPKKAWIIDPTNYITLNNRSSVFFTETVGKILARTPFLKKLKDFVDRFARNKLPVLASITPPLLQLTKNVTQPILSLHIASGNILAAAGKQVVQMVTDPHVREDYLNEAERKNIVFLVFDNETKLEFMEKARLLNKKIDQNKVIVTGPPVDPRVVQSAQNKQIWQDGPIKLCITTGGLGTNKNEIKQVLEQLLPELHQDPCPYQLLVYAGTHQDIFQMVVDLANSNNIAVNKIVANDPANFSIDGDLSQLSNNQKPSFSIKDEKLSIIYHPQIVDANELLIHLGFPWADGFISKPSGDMAYDAVASGSFLLTLKEWGEWEHNIRKIFTKLNVATVADTNNIVKQLDSLKARKNQKNSWIEEAMRSALNINALFTQGANNIIKTVEEIRETNKK